MYAELYGKLLESYSKIRGLFGLQRSLTFEEYSSLDIENYICKQNMPVGKIDEILNHYSTDKENAIKIMVSYLRMIEFQEAHFIYEKFSGFYWVNELYLSPEISIHFSKIRQGIYSLLMDYENREKFPTRTSFQEIGVSEKELDIELNMLVEYFQKEIRGEKLAITNP